MKVEGGVMVVQAAVTVSEASAECKLNKQRLLSLLTPGPFLCVNQIYVDEDLECMYSGMNEWLYSQWSVAKCVVFFSCFLSLWIGNTPPFPPPPTLAPPPQLATFFSLKMNMAPKKNHGFTGPELLW